MSTQATIAVNTADPGYDYSLLDHSLAQEVRAASRRIREQGRLTLLGIVKTGLDLRLIKKALPRKQYLPWIKADFGWDKRTAQHYVRVAIWLEAKTNLVSLLNIAPSAAYLLAARSAPEAARQEALERAAAGEFITKKIARAILERHNTQQSRMKKLPGSRLWPKLAQVLQRYRERWQTEDLPQLAEQLRAFADEVDSQQE